MTRTPLARWLQDAASVAAEAASRDIDTGQVIAERTERRVSRRGLLKLAGASGLAAGMSVLATRPAAGAAGNPRIVVVGARLAGLTCAYRLKQAGYAATVDEASDRLGGRCRTIRGQFAEGQVPSAVGR